jgi:hypothetical protein
VSALGCAALTPGAGWFADDPYVGRVVDSELSSSALEQAASASEPNQTMCVEQNLSFMRKPRLMHCNPCR